MSERPYPRYYDLDGTPARIVSELHTPEIYAGYKIWKSYDDRFELISTAVPISAAEASKLERRFDASLWA